MHNHTVSKKAVSHLIKVGLLSGACFAALASIPAVAQDSMETVVVTGIRGSLQRNLDIKREAAGLTDAITMEDIGKFPDTNLAEALMRIPGVTTSFTSGMTNNGQSVTTGEGVSITVRGFGPTFNETLFDGRVVPSGIGGRSFDFSGLSADMVSQLQVLKSPDATLSSGAIGATIDVVYPKPFDKPGLTVAGSGSGTLGADDGRWKPNGNFLISDTFDNDKFGVLVAGAYSSLSTSQQQFQNWGWIGQYVAPCQLASYTGPDCNALEHGSTTTTSTTVGNTTTSVTTTIPPNPNTVNDTTKPVWWTQDYAVDFNRIQEERMNGRLALQWQPTDSLVVTVDANYARDNLNEDSLTYALWNNVGEMRNITTSPFGTVTNFGRTSPTDFDDVKSQSLQQTYTYGLNAKWSVDDHIAVTLDLSQAMSALNPGDNHFSEVSEDLGYGPSQTGGTNGMTYTVTQPGGHGVPYYGGIGPNGNASQFLNTNIMGSHVMMVIANRNRNLVNEAKLESQFTYDTLTFKIGAQYTPEHFKMASYVNHWDTNNEWQSFAGYGPDSNNYYNGNPLTPAGVHIPSNLFTGVRTIRDIPGWSEPSGGVIPGLPIFDANAVYAYLNGLGTSVSCPGGVPTIKGFNCSSVNAAGYTGILPQLSAQFDPNGYQHVYEDTYSAYASFATEAKLADMPLKINGGVRYEYTRLWASGFGRDLKALTVSAGDHTAYDFAYGPTSVVAKKNAYSYLLPNIDLNLLITDDLHLRFDASRTMTRPPLSDLKGNLTYSGRVGSLSATGGNPYELPYIADNFDLSAEWYYAPNSYVSVDSFLKNVSNWVVAGTSQITVPGVLNGGSAVFTLQSNVNGPSANIYGLEVAWQHVFGDSGFGYLINGTVVDTNKPYDPNNLSVGNFGMPGLADSANFTAFYDKYGFEFRVAANWRDIYLDSFGQGQASGTQFGSEPIFVNGSWDLTISTGYDITDNAKIYFEADNLMDQAYSTRGRFPDQMYSVIQVGRRFTAGVHFKL